ncbi:hypothetical protein [Mangrovivirga cuniculi]|uniref:Uncharacterized protein n=1 Tax=Mangrovivirga cuniculi TaxID=2715131 RepID=A0A4D7JF39_9BACT|nr:hypothetical protein [Mangrovivirga cuniculi]QCK13337.1 hypothetical protein DCC35_00520 [Mangrovivirga cuniculi]
MSESQTLHFIKKFGVFLWNTPNSGGAATVGSINHKKPEFEDIESCFNGDLSLKEITVPCD